jgi:two-component SAPR family response regulator
MAYNPYRWFTQQRKRKLPKSRPLLERIQNGDFEYSIYFDEAKNVRESAEKVYNDVMQNALISNERQKENEANLSSRMKRVRALKLMEEADKDERNILKELQDELTKEFGVDLWDKAMEKQRGKGTTEDIYWWYKKQVGQTYTKSELQLRGINVKN